MQQADTHMSTANAVKLSWLSCRMDRLLFKIYFTYTCGREPRENVSKGGGLKGNWTNVLSITLTVAKGQEIYCKFLETLES